MPAARQEEAREEQALPETPAVSDMNAQVVEDELREFGMFRLLSKGRWQGVWQTYGELGDKEGEVTAVVDVAPPPEDEESLGMTHELKIPGGDNVKRMPVAKFATGRMGPVTVVGDGFLSGPSVLRSGAMSVELCMRYGDGRIRATFLHAPVWKKGETQVGAPDGLKVFRVVLAREALRDAPPAPAAEQSSPPGLVNPTFFRGVSPFKWHARWGGVAHTKGALQGRQRFEVTELDEPAAWHGRPRGDDPNTWCLRLPGGVLLQCPHVVRPGVAETVEPSHLPPFSRARPACLPHAPKSGRTDGGRRTVSDGMATDRRAATAF